MRFGSMIDALSMRSPTIVVTTSVAALVLAWLNLPLWLPIALAIAVGALAFLLFAARGGRRSRREVNDEQSWVGWEVAGKGTPAGFYLLAFVAFAAIMMTGMETAYAAPGWAAFALNIAWGIANRRYPPKSDAGY